MEVGLCQAFSEMLQSNIEDLDAEDWEDPQLCSDYVKDIYRYLRQLEVSRRAVQDASENSAAPLGTSGSTQQC